MLRSLYLENYRGFSNFAMRNLGRVNLIVGTNNSGKTSVLEAIHILKSMGDLGPLWSIMSRRGEDIIERDVNNPIPQVDTRRLFNGHEIDIGSKLKIEAETDKGVESFIAEINEWEKHSSDQLGLFDSIGSASAGTPVDLYGAIEFNWSSSAGTAASGPLEVSHRGGLSYDHMRKVGRASDIKRLPVRFITSSAMSPNTAVDLFEDIVLTPYENFVIDSLKIIDPTIDRIASTGSDRRWSGSTRNGVRGGLLVRCKGMPDRIPIGSMGDGIWRILGLALALVRTEGGILLIDEIDTGLHYTVMEDMWRLVNETAKRHDIQVFATTHSRDCFESFAAISSPEAAESGGMTIQRIERGNDEAVAYTEQEIVAAARRHLEVR